MPRPHRTPLILTIAVVLTGCHSSVSNAPGSSASPAASPFVSPTYDPSLTDLNRVKPGTLAPDFELDDMEGKKIRLSDYRGRKYVVLVFYRGYF